MREESLFKSLGVLHFCPILKKKKKTTFRLMRLVDDLPKLLELNNTSKMCIPYSRFFPILPYLFPTKKKKKFGEWIERA